MADGRDEFSTADADQDRRGRSGVFCEKFADSGSGVVWAIRPDVEGLSLGKCPKAPCVIHAGDALNPSYRIFDARNVDDPEGRVFAICLRPRKVDGPVVLLNRASY